MNDVFFVKRGYIGIQIELSRDIDCAKGRPITLMVEDEAFGNLTRVALNVYEAKLVADALLQRANAAEGKQDAGAERCGRRERPDEGERGMKVKDARVILEWRIKDDARDAQIAAETLVERLQSYGLNEDLKDVVDDLRALANAVENDFYRWRRLPAKDAEK